MSEARKIELGHVSMTVTPAFTQTGSIGADTAKSELTSIATSLEIESQAPEALVAKLVATAERMCFLMDALRRPHTVETAVTLNGKPLAS